MRKFITTIIAVCMIMSLVACGAKDEVQNETTSTNEHQESTEKGESFIGVFRGEDYTIVFAQDVEPIEDYKGEIKIAIDMGFGYFFPYTAKIVSDTEITDFTYRGDEIVAEFDFKLDGDTLYFQRVVSARDIEDNITLQRTDEDPAEVYKELLQKSAEIVAQNPPTDVPDKVDEQTPEITPQPETSAPDVDVSTETGTIYPFIGLNYKHENLDLTFQLKAPDADGNPTEITLNGAAYMEYTFENETYELSNVSITEDMGCYYVKATWYIGEQEYLLDMQDAGDNSWKMYGPGMCSGYYFPE